MPSHPQFLASRSAVPASIVLVGAPLDLTESFRPGCGFAPAHIREVSDSIESFSPVLNADIEDINLVDGGDITLAGIDVEAALSAIEQWVATAASDAPFLLLGGEHTVALGAIRGLAKRYPDLSVLQVDAHLDLIDSYQERKVSHATVFRRVSEIVGLEALAQVGVRSGTRDEYALARGCLHSSPDLSLPAAARAKLQGKPVYLSIDIDVLDPAYAPGTGNPEPGGCSFRDLADFVYSLRGLNIVGIDVVEVSPPLDPSDITSIAAAKLVRELVLLFGKPSRLAGG